MASSLSGNIALVTGASRGIGAAIADELAAQGAVVIGTATTDAGAQSISARLASSSGHGYVLNVADQASIDALAQETSTRHGAISILVNNAGITQDTLLMRMKDAQWQDVIETNLTSIYRMCKVFTRDMVKARSGRVINISSVVASTGNPGQTNYAAAKAGMIGFSKSLAKELGPRGITVNVVSPGFIDTDMTHTLPEALKRDLLGRIALGRLGKAQEIADAVAFLASAKAHYITGETLHVNGGMYMP